MALGHGMTVFETEPNGKAAEDMKSVIDEILKSVNNESMRA